jgi:hypothetical protein
MSRLLCRFLLECCNIEIKFGHNIEIKFGYNIEIKLGCNIEIKLGKNIEIRMVVVSVNIMGVVSVNIMVVGFSVNIMVDVVIGQEHVVLLCEKMELR